MCVCVSPCVFASSYFRNYSDSRKVWRLALLPYYLFYAGCFLLYLVYHEVPTQNQATRWSNSSFKVVVVLVVCFWKNVYDRREALSQSFVNDRASKAFQLIQQVNDDAFFVPALPLVSPVLFRFACIFACSLVGAPMMHTIKASCGNETWAKRWVGLLVVEKQISGEKRTTKKQDPSKQRLLGQQAVHGASLGLWINNHFSY